MAAIGTDCVKTTSALPSVVTSFAHLPNGITADNEYENSVLAM